MHINNGTCRGNDAGKIVDFINDQNNDAPGERSVADICAKLGRGTAYVRSLVVECDRLAFSRSDGNVSTWTVVVPAPRVHYGA